MANKQPTKWFASSQLPNHADNTTIKDDAGGQLHFVHPNESVLVIGTKQYCEQYVDQLNQAVQDAHHKITLSLNEKFGTPKAMEATASSSVS